MLRTPGRSLAFALAALVLAAVLAARAVRAGGEARPTGWKPEPERDTPPLLCIPSYTGGVDVLAGNVATVQFLQIYTTLRQADGDRVFHQRGLMVWGDQPLSASGHAPATAWGQKNKCRTVLWGNVHKFGESLVVQTQFTVLPSADTGLETPSLESPKFGRVTLELPATRYTFTPVVLTRDVVEKYKAPNSLVMYSEPHGKGTVVGPLGPTFQSLIATESTVKVTSHDKTGWLNLPHLAKNRSEAVDFVSAFIRTLRRDYDGAADYYQRVLDNPEASVSVRADVNLYLAIGDLKRGMPALARKHVAAALELDPYSSSAHRFAVYVELTFAVVKRDTTLLRKALDASKNFVPDDDRVLAAARKVAGP